MFCSQPAQLFIQLSDVVKHLLGLHVPFSFFDREIVPLRRLGEFHLFTLLLSLGDFEFRLFPHLF